MIIRFMKLMLELL